MTLEERILKAKEYDDKLEELVKEKEKIENAISLLEVQRDDLYNFILEEFKEKQLKEEKVDNIFATYFYREDVDWLDDAGLLKALQENNASQYISTKVTTKTSVDKKALKNAFKTDDALRETYKDFYGKKVIEYVTITTEENHQKMLEHIEASKK